MVKELIEYVVRQLAQDLESVAIVMTKNDDKQVIEITVSDRDRGRLIGRRGQTIKALRLLVDVVRPQGKKIMVNILE